MKRCSTPSGLRDQGAQVTVYETKATVHGTTSAGTPPSPRRACGGGGGGHGGDVGNVMCLYTALSLSFPFQCPAFPPGCKGQHPEPVLRGFHTTDPEPIHVPGNQTTLPGCGRWSRPPTECVSTPSPGSHPQPYTTDERCPWRALGSSKCGTWRSANARSWRLSRRDNPFLSIGILPIYVKQRSLLAAYRVSRQAEKTLPTHTM